MMFGRSFLSEKSALAQLAWFIGLTLTIYLFFTMVTVLLAIPFFGIDVIATIQNLNSGGMAENLTLAKYLQVTNHIGMMIIPAVVFAWFAGNGISNYLFLEKVPQRRVFALVLLIGVISMPFLSKIIEWNMGMNLPESFQAIEDWMREQEDTSKELTDLILSEKAIGAFLFNIFMMAIIPAFSEEFLFRGVIYRILKKGFGNAHVAIFVSSILFSAIHLQFYGFFPRFLLGMMFGYLVHFTGSLWPAMFAHFLNNGIVVVAAFITNPNTTIEEELDLTGVTTWSVALISLVLTLFMFYYIYSKEKKAEELE